MKIIHFFIKEEFYSYNIGDSLLNIYKAFLCIRETFTQVLFISFFFSAIHIILLKIFCQEVSDKFSMINGKVKSYDTGRSRRKIFASEMNYLKNPRDKSIY